MERLFDAWMLGHKLFCTQSDYGSYLKAIQPLTQDSTCRSLFNYSNETAVTAEGLKNYKEQRADYTSKGYFDTESGLWVYLEDFDQLLSDIKCPVLALFGTEDSQVDWRKTKALYERTIGVDTTSNLTVKTFSNCNHSLQKCITCGFQEDLSALRWQACDGYYETMEDWLRLHQIIE